MRGIVPTYIKQYKAIKPPTAASIIKFYSVVVIKYL